MAKIEEAEGKLNLIFYCPGCKNHHGVSTSLPRPTWTWNGSMDKPTFSPSIRVQTGPKCDPVTHLRLDEKDRICHFFVKDGFIQYLNDCTHDLAGKTVEMVDIENV